MKSSVFGPSLLFAIGQGAVVPVLALYALDIGGTPAVAGAAVAVRGLSTMVFDMPAGILVSRYGDARATGLASIVLALAALGVALGPSLIVYFFLVVAMGFAWAVWLIARIAYATDLAPMQYRGRVMAMIGGMSRVGAFVGSLAGVVVIRLGGLAGPFVLAGVLAVGAWVMVASTEPKVHHRARSTAARIPIREVIREHATTFRTVGIVALIFQVLRSSRQVVIPIWADQIGIGASEISLLFAYASALEAALFYPVGKLMDSKGRKWAAIPSLVLMSLGLGLVPLTSSFASLTVIAVLLGVGNGLGSGINLTFASDFSSAEGRNEFLGVWRLLGDAGAALGPMTLAAIIPIASVSAATMGVASIGVAGLFVLWLRVPEPLVARRSNRDQPN